MKYVCIDKNDTSCYGSGDTLESAFEQIEEFYGTTFADTEWYELTPIKVKMTITQQKDRK
jgi:predicted RNase H-like HicB family nuclease